MKKKDDDQNEVQKVLSQMLGNMGIEIPMTKAQMESHLKAQSITKKYKTMMKTYYDCFLIHLEAGKSAEEADALALTAARVVEDRIVYFSQKADKEVRNVCDCEKCKWEKAAE